MPVITEAIQNFISAQGANSIAPIPPAGPNQRGPTCGFYALAYVMLYWYLRQNELGGNFGLAKPLTARTHNVFAPVNRASPTEKDKKALLAKSGQYSSLRHYGKHNQLTAYGSVFNAENMVKVAHGASNGQYDGHVVELSGQEDFVTKVKALIAIECPVIVPFDVDVNTQDATSNSGKAAHWATIIGAYVSDGSDFVIHYHWGKFHWAEMRSFGHSNSQLTANAFLDFKKCEAYIFKPGVGRFVPSLRLFTVRDFMTDDTIDAYRKAGFTVKILSEAVTNYEFCQPKSVEELKTLEELQKKFPDLAQALSGEKLRHAGFDAMNLTNAGLKDKVVAIYPAVEKDFVRSVA